MIPGGRMNPRQMERMMRQMGIKADELKQVQEVVIRTADKEYVFTSPSVMDINAQGQRMFQVIGEPKVTDRKGTATAAAPPKLAIPEEDVQLVAQQAGVSPQAARKALEECGGEPAAAILKLKGS